MLANGEAYVVGAVAVGVGVVLKLYVPAGVIVFEGVVWEVRSNVVC